MPPGPAEPPAVARAEASAHLGQEQRLLVPHVQPEHLLQDLHLGVVARVGGDRRGQLGRQQVEDMGLLELPPDVAVVAAGLGLQRRVEQLPRDGRMHAQGPGDDAEGPAARRRRTVDALVGGEEPLQLGVGLDDHRARIHGWPLLRSCAWPP